MEKKRSGPIRQVPTVWEHDGNRWIVAFDLMKIAGLIRCVGVSIRLDIDGRDLSAAPRPLTTTLLRTFPFDSYLRSAMQKEAQRQLDMGEDWLGLGDASVVQQTYPAGELLLHGGAPMAPEVADRVRRLVIELGIPNFFEQRAGEAERTARPPGRPVKHGPAVLERIARLWLEAVNERGSASPIKDVANALGRDYSRNVVAKLVMKCRKEGLLPPVGWDEPWPAEENDAERTEGHEKHP